MGRSIFYIALVILIAVMVNLKINIIKEKRNAEVISITNEFKKHGKPVETYEVKKDDFKFYERVTGEYSKKELKLYLSRLQWNKIKPTQNVVIVGTSITGKITFVGQQAETLTGLYQATVKLDSHLDRPINTNVVVDVEYKKLKDIVQVPETSVKTENGEKFVWILDDKGVAQKKVVKTGARANYHIQILEGLELGEKVIVRGMSKLKSDDQIRIVNNGESK